MLMDTEHSKIIEVLSAWRSVKHVLWWLYYNDGFFKKKKQTKLIHLIQKDYTKLKNTNKQNK